MKYFPKKTCSYGLMHLVVAMTVAYLISGSWQVALGIGLIEPLVQTFAYTFHEEVWSRYLAKAPVSCDSRRHFGRRKL